MLLFLVSTSVIYAQPGGGHGGGYGSGRADEATLQKRLDEQRKRCDNARSISKQLDEILKGVQKRTKERADKICKKMRLELSQGKK